MRHHGQGLFQFYFTVAFSLDHIWEHNLTIYQDNWAPTSRALFTLWYKLPPNSRPSLTYEWRQYLSLSDTVNMKKEYVYIYGSYAGTWWPNAKDVFFSWFVERSNFSEPPKYISFISNPTVDSVNTGPPTIFASAFTFGNNKIKTAFDILSILNLPHLALHVCLLINLI